MMNDKDCEEYDNIGRKIPLKERFQYVSGKQITDGDTGKRVYLSHKHVFQYLD